MMAHTLLVDGKITSQANGTATDLQAVRPLPCALCLPRVSLLIVMLNNRLKYND